MKKLLNDYLHFYLGCEVIAQTEKYGEVRALLMGVHIPEVSRPVTVAYNGELLLLNFNKVKPILHSLDSVGVSEFLTRPLASSINSTLRQELSSWANLLNQLRAGNIDCDGLIEAGLAIDATTLNDK